ncbi:YtxH domain-containing protein [Paenibacillus sp. HJL G12]|uniref:YtxH domain-containing protein n=1 Tax=Paenibacillus dendrobii TaxID=2691084 RepID=A0A7X3IKR2_9BACL|nr:YtxH domain-containing protein [Paenibacillus dendrobii]MWV43832.1 YtxH domain-containing protein [Paenibacillus dendrobii]
MKEKNKSLLWGALIGSVVGSVTALLLAPKSGKELRQDIAEGARTVGSKTQELAGKVGEQGANLIVKVKDTAGNVISDIRGWRKSESDPEDSDESCELAQISSFADGGEQEPDFAEESKQDAGDL